MKAILIKYLSATNTQGARLKATTEAGSLIEPIDYALNDDQQFKQLANRYIKHVGWECIVSGFGTLPNGDCVATLSV